MSTDIQSAIVFIANDRKSEEISKEIAGKLIERLGQRQFLNVLFHGLEKFQHEDHRFYSGAMKGLQEVLRRKDIDE